jgi:hypothetical protein
MKSSDEDGATKQSPLARQVCLRTYMTMCKKILGSKTGCLDVHELVTSPLSLFGQLCGVGLPAFPVEFTIESRYRVLDERVPGCSSYILRIPKYHLTHEQPQAYKTSQLFSGSQLITANGQTSTFLRV